MKYLSMLTAMVLMLFLVGCATVEVPQATGGSRADGVVRLSYQYGLFQKPRVQWGRAHATAKARCEAWGYSDAQRFGGEVKHCEARNGYGNCTEVLVTVPYQCTGNPRKRE